MKTTTMNTTKHTPGPWSFSPFGDADFEVCDHKSQAICDILDNGNPDDSKRHDALLANARLIAAAPEMLRLLKDISYNLDQPDGRIYGSGFIFEEDEEAREVIRKVIAQAEGENL